MIKRPTWIMVIALALIAGLTYYMQTVPDNFISKAFAAPTPTIAASTALGTLIASTDGPVNGISIADATGHSVILKREPAGWVLSIDNQKFVPADQSAAEQAASQAQALRLTAAEIKPAASDLPAFGVDNPSYIYQLVLANGKTVTFKIGKATITGDGYYLQKEDGTVTAVEKFSLDLLLNLLKQPPYMFPLTSTPTTTLTPAIIELPTGTITPTPAATLSNTATPGT